MSHLDEGGKLKHFLWFTLYELMRLGAIERVTRISTTGLSLRRGGSQQSASRHLRLLERRGYISRRVDQDGSLIRVTPDGVLMLEEVYRTLRLHLDGVEDEVFEFEGVVFSGMFQGGYYIAQEGYAEQIQERLGFQPYPGTLNMRLKGDDLEKRKRLDMLPGVKLEGFKVEERAFGGARCYPLTVNGEVEGALIVADRTSYDLSVMEIISPVNLRKSLSLEDGDTVTITLTNRQPDTG